MIVTVKLNETPHVVVLHHDNSESKPFPLKDGNIESALRAKPHQWHEVGQKGVYKGFRLINIFQGQAQPEGHKAPVHLTGRHDNVPTFIFATRLISAEDVKDIDGSAGIRARGALRDNANPVFYAAAGSDGAEYLECLTDKAQKNTILIANDGRFLWPSQP